jgi:hypothetical protein
MRTHGCAAMDHDPPMRCAKCSSCVMTISWKLSWSRRAAMTARSASARLALFSVVLRVTCVTCDGVLGEGEQPARRAAPPPGWRCSLWCVM